MGISYKQLNVFIRIYQLGSVTAAAQMLDISQPSASKSLALLEQRVGQMLFQKTNGKMEPTEAAQQLYIEAIKIQESLDRFDKSIIDIRDNQARLKICATPALALNFLPPLIKQLKSELTNFGFTIDMVVNNEIENAISQQNYDIGLKVHPLAIKQKASETVAIGEIVCVLPKDHALSKLEILTWEDININEVIYITTDSNIIDIISHHIPDFRNRPANAMETNRYSIAINAVKNNLGITLVDEFSLFGIDLEEIVIRKFSPKITLATSIFFSNRIQENERTTIKKSINNLFRFQSD
ncbi:LysR family transcriptional regulator [Acinetobacter baumannii]|uniref:LysR family transcriptional regulator n=1 Tax=Acinetobacter baumannii TaxID=470 RepID=UPI0002B99C3E|nr:LysR family transcriptional regulator [Acinetobacter baumannii]